MRTRKAILPDAKHIHELIAAYSGDGTLLPRTLPEICENMRDFVVLEEDGNDHRLRRAASLRHASGGDPLHYGRTVGAGQRRRRTTGESATGRSQAAPGGLHLPVYAQARLFRGTGLFRGPARGSTRQDLQRLPCLPAISLLR